MSERVVRFGADNGITGVYTRATGAEDQAAEQDQNGAAAVLFLSAGLLHKVGPNRLHVDLARRCASRGHAALRFDMSGIGDSPPRTDGATEEQRAVEDTIAAMDVLERRFGHRRFILFGLCSGADNAHAVAVRDRRVSGMICLDAYIYGTPRYHLHRYVDRYVKFFLSPRRMIGYVRRRLRTDGRRPGASEASSAGSPEDAFVRPFPPKERVERELERLAARGMRMFFIYSGGYSLYAYADQFQRCFKGVPFGDSLTVRYFEKANHIYTLGRDRRALMDAVVDWLADARSVAGNGATIEQSADRNRSNES